MAEEKTMEETTAAEAVPETERLGELLSEALAALNSRLARMLILERRLDSIQVIQRNLGGDPAREILTIKARLWDTSKETEQLQILVKEIQARIAEAERLQKAEKEKELAEKVERVRKSVGAAG